MKQQKRKAPLRLGRSAVIGLRIGAVIVGIMAAVTFAVIGFQTYQTRTGTIGGEILILPAFVLFFYVGWVARKDTEQRQRSQQREERVYAARSRGSAITGSKS